MYLFLTDRNRDSRGRRNDDTGGVKRGVEESVLEDHLLAGAIHNVTITQF